MIRDDVDPVLLALGAAALFGAATPIAKVRLASIGPFQLAGLFYLGAAAAVVPAASMRGLPSRRRFRANAARLAGVVLFGGVLAPVLPLGGLSLSGAASVALWLNLEPLVTVLLAWLLFKEHLHGRAWVSLCLVLALASKRYLETELLRQVSGVGAVTALSYVLTLEEPGRFPSSRSVGAYVGLAASAKPVRRQGPGAADHEGGG